MANAINAELEGKVVLIKKEYMKPEFHDDDKRRFMCEGGFGCHPWTLGKAIFGYYLIDGEKDRIEGYMVDKIVEDSNG